VHELVWIKLNESKCTVKQWNLQVKGILKWKQFCVDIYCFWGRGLNILIMVRLIKTVTSILVFVCSHSFLLWSCFCLHFVVKPIRENFIVWKEHLVAYQEGLCCTQWVCVGLFMEMHLESFRRNLSGSRLGQMVGWCGHGMYPRGP